MRSLFLVLALLAAGLAASPASAHRGRGRVHFGIAIGAPLWHGPWYYGSPYYYGPAVVVRPEPQVYIEKDPPGTELDATQYWYYCPDSKTYYPYVKHCASPWHREIPHPAPQ